MRHKEKRATAAAGVLLLLAALTAACQGGVGVGLGYSYPGRIHEMGGGKWTLINSLLT